MEVIETCKEILVQVGAGWVLWLLFGLSFIGVAVVLERWWYFRSKTDDVTVLAARLDAHFSSGAFVDALESLRTMRSVGAAVARAGLRLAPLGAAAAEKGMQSATCAERKQLEARLAFLGTLGNNAPFLGLFGTVIGVILAFEELGQASNSASGAVSQVASSGVMAAIAEALVATAAGIAVALPAVAAYNYLQRRVATLLDDAETLSSLVLAYLMSREDDLGRYDEAAFIRRRD